MMTVYVSRILVLTRLWVENKHTPTTVVNCQQRVHRDSMLGDYRKCYLDSHKTIHF